jgi:hypothetical protein
LNRKGIDFDESCDWASFVVGVRCKVLASLLRGGHFHGFGRSNVAFDCGPDGFCGKAAPFEAFFFAVGEFVGRGYGASRAQFLG